MLHAYEIPNTLANPRSHDRYLRLRGRVVIANLADFFSHAAPELRGNYCRPIVLLLERGVPHIGVHS